MMPQSSLASIIQQHLEKSPLSAADYMGLALYHPQGGYYRREKAPWGFEGKDYYTALDCGPLLGQTLALRLEEVWKAMGSPDAFTILEPGAGRGWLGRDLLAHASEAFRPSLRYLHQDNNPAALALARAALAPFGDAVRFIDEEETLAPFSGAIISNELFDALPAQPWRWDGRAWQREVLTLEGPIWQEAGPDEAQEAWQWFEANAEGGLEPDDGSIWCEGLPCLIQRLVTALEKGIFIAIDYGDTASRLLDKGSDLRRFKDHQVDGQWWEAPGDGDLTADVDFTRLAALLEQAGLDTPSTINLGRWIRTHAPLQAWEQTWQTLDARERMKRMENLLSLTLPGMMGDRFKVLEAMKPSLSAGDRLDAQ